SIDDFGTGYSSLSCLKQFPIDRLKIDRVFVSSLSEDSSDMAIIEAIIAMAKGLRLSAVAEGVETLQQLELLRSLKCNEIQGFLFSEPLPVNEAEQLLADDSLLCA
ncbi:MAG: EAL domain-containing protein, partial [Actinomycetota bacterium]